MLLKLDFSSDIPIYMQIRNQLVLGIAEGKLSPGERLPTIRTLAAEIGVNVMTVNKAYALLKQEGYILADRRSGARVNPNAVPSGLQEEMVAAHLGLAVSEAKAAGIDRETLLEMCSRLFDEGEAKR